MGDAPSQAADGRNERGGDGALRRGARVLLRGSRPGRAGRRNAGGAVHPSARGRGPGQGAAGRRHAVGVPGVAGAVQRRPRALQGRPPVPSRRLAGRVPLLLRADDLEDRARRHPLRRREGRHPRRPEGPVGG